MRTLDVLLGRADGDRVHLDPSWTNSWGAVFGGTTVAALLHRWTAALEDGQMLRSAHLAFDRPAAVDEPITVAGRIATAGRRVARLQGEVTQGERVLVHGFAVAARSDGASTSPEAPDTTIPAPDELAEAPGDDRTADVIRHHFELPGRRMTGPLAGVRVVEVATHVFVPVAGALLAEWGAEVIKVEHPETGDPYRSLVTAGLHNVHHGYDPFFQSANRGKRSVGIDLARPEGRALLGRLLAGADVFTTSLRSPAREALRIDVDDVRADNPRVVYVRGTAFGAQGPEEARGGYDSGAYWARTGMQHLFTGPDDAWPRGTRPAFGDLVGGLALAGAVGTALFRRATTGEASVVDSSLLGTGMWQVGPDIVNAHLGDEATHARQPDRYAVWNPLMLPYRTADGRFVALMVLAPDRHWAQLCDLLGRPELLADPRFVDMEARRVNARACVEALEAAFAERPLAAWRDRLAAFAGEWTVVQEPGELRADPQVLANGYLAAVPMADGAVTLPMVTAPVQFDEVPSQPSRAPELGEHTEEVLLALGCTWDELTDLKAKGAIL